MGFQILCYTNKAAKLAKEGCQAAKISVIIKEMTEKEMVSAFQDVRNDCCLNPEFQ